MEVYDVFLNTFSNLWMRMVNFLPAFFAVLLVCVLGWLAAALLKRLVEQGLKLARLDDALDKLGLEAFHQKTGYRIRVSRLAGEFVRWFLILVVALVAADLLQLARLSEFFNEVLLYLPNVLVAVVILLAGGLLGNVAGDLVRKSVRLTPAAAGFISSVARWGIFVFAFLAALTQLQVTPELIQILFTGFVAMLALAGGLAFGLGGKEHATRLLGELEKSLRGNSRPQG